jgi:hypothetical protein
MSNPSQRVGGSMTQLPGQLARSILRRRWYSTALCGLLAILLLISDAGAVRADFIPLMVETSSKKTGDGSISDSSYSRVAGGHDGLAYFETSTSAEAALSPFALLRTSAVARTVGQGAGLSGYAIASAGYQDIVSVVNGVAPDLLRFNFALDGGLDVSVTPNGAGFARVDVVNYVNRVGNFEGWDNNGVPSVIAAVYDAEYDAGGVFRDRFDSIGWDSQDAGSYTYHIDVPYDEQIGGYGFTTIMQSTAFANGSFAPSTVAISSFDHTLKLTGLSLSDGTPLDTANFRFESGLSFDARPVPEPSTYMLAVTGAVCAYGVSGMRRRYCRNAARRGRRCDLPDPTPAQQHLSNQRLR